MRISNPPNFIMKVSLIMKLIMTLIVFQCETFAKYAPPHTRRAVRTLQPCNHSSCEGRSAFAIVMRSGAEPPLIQKRSRHAALVSSACFAEAGQQLWPLRQAAAVPFSWAEAPCRKHM